MGRVSWRTKRFLQRLSWILKTRFEQRTRLSTKVWLPLGALLALTLLLAGSGSAVLALTEHRVLALTLFAVAGLLFLVCTGISIATLLRLQAEKLADRILERLHSEVRSHRQEPSDQNGGSSGLLSPAARPQLAGPELFARAGHPEELEEAQERLRSADRKLLELYKMRSDKIWKNIRMDHYFNPKANSFRYQAIWTEIDEMIHEVAQLYHADSRSSIMEAQFGQVVLMIGHIAHRFGELLSRIPIVDLKNRSLLELVELLRRAEKVRRTARSVSDLWFYVRPFYYGTRIYLGANVALFLAWTLGGEYASRLAKRLTLDRTEKWVLRLLEELIWMLYVHLAMAYGGLPGGRSLEWLVHAHVISVHAKIAGSDSNRRHLERKILAAPLWNELDRLELLNALSNNDPAPLGPIGEDLQQLCAEMDDATRNTLADLFADAFTGLHGLQDEAAVTAIQTIERALGRGLGLDYAESGHPWGERLEEAFRALAALCRERNDLDEKSALTRLEETDLVKNAQQRDRGVTSKVLAETVEAVYGSSETPTFTVPFSLLGTEKEAKHFVKAVIELCDHPQPPWTETEDEAVRQAITRLILDRKSRARAWAKHLENARGRLRSLTTEALLVQLDDPASCRSVLRRVRPGDPLLAVSSAKLEGAYRWVAIFEQKIVVGPPLDELCARASSAILELPLDQVELSRISRKRSADELALHLNGQTVLLPGSVMSSFDKRFGPLLRGLGREATASASSRPEHPGGS